MRNVNLRWRLFLHRVTLGFYLTDEECKSDLPVDALSPFSRFYLTDEECKCRLICVVGVLHHRFYLTDEECKCTSSAYKLAELVESFYLTDEECKC